MKDIYSPLEIDEQWDQRAPLAETKDGDAAAVGTLDGTQASDESVATTATIEPQTHEAPSNDTTDPMEMIGSPSDAAADPLAESPHIGPVNEGSTTSEESSVNNNSETPPITAASPASETSSEDSDDAAIAKLSGDHVAEEATTDPNDDVMNSMNPQPGDSIVPTASVEPSSERVQPDESVKEVDDTEASSSDAESDSAEHFVLGGSDTNTVEPSETTSEPEASSDSKAKSDVLAEMDEEFKRIMQELEAEDKRLDTLIQEIDEKIVQDQHQKADLEGQKKEIEDRKSKVQTLVNS